MSAILLAFTILLALVASGLGLFVCYLLFLLGRMYWYAQTAYFQGAKVDEDPPKPKPAKKARRWLKWSLKRKALVKT